MSSAWDKPVRLAEVSRGALRLTLEPDEAARVQIAQRLRLDGLPAFSAQVQVRPWLDGAELVGKFTARVVQTCGVSLELFEQDLSGDIEVRMLPAGSKNAPEDVEPGGELTLDIDAPDPPDTLEGDEIDVAHYVIEHLALEVDPFPRKPGATFDYAPPQEETSPFAVLLQLKDKKA